MDDKLIVGQRHTEAARELADYAGFKFAADHLDMALDATAEAFARFERDHMPAAVGGEAVNATRECTVCGAGVAEWPTVMCCHCQEIPWKLREPSTLTPVPAAVEERAREAKHVIGRLLAETHYGNHALVSAADVNALTAALTNAQPIRAGLREALTISTDALEACGKQFRFYEVSHRKKGTPDADEKARVNANMAATCEDRVRDARAALATPDNALTERAEDTKLLNAIRDECWDVRCFSTPTGGDDADVAWRVVGHWQAEPRERVVAEEYNDDPRVAIRAAIRALLTRAPGQGEGK